MKKILFSLIGLSYLINGCSSSDDGGGASCPELSSINVVQNIDKLNFTLTSTSPAMYYEVSAVVPQWSSDQNPNSGSIRVLDELTGSLAIGEFVANDGDIPMMFYARAVCSDGSKSAWTAPKMLTVHEYCQGPTDLSYFLGLQWQDQWTGGASSWQVEYGVTGFTIGSGTRYNTNTTNLSGIPLQANTTYDFYVRGNCGATGWSAWTGPYTYFSPVSENLCMAPTNLSYTVSYMNGSNYGIEISYNGNGESQFEYALMTGTTPPGAGSISTIGTGFTPAYTGLSTFQTYTFFIRGVCANGNRTPWATMTVDQ